MYSVLHRRCPQYLLDLITFNDGDSGRRCLRSTIELPTFSAHGHNSATKLSQSVAPTIWNSLHSTYDTASY